MTTNHTPGPWAVDNLTVRWGGYFVADCDGKGDIARQGECQANARLIAAAPDLLDALVALSGALQTYVNGTEDWPELMQARAAIAKAGGAA